MNEANKILDTYNVIVGSAVTVLAAIFGSIGICSFSSWFLMYLITLQD